MLEYLSPKDGPVIPGLQNKEVVYAEDQPEYLPLRTLVSAGPERRVLSRWALTPEQREAILRGADVFLELITFGKPLQPIRLMVSDGKFADLCSMSSEWIETAVLDSTTSKKDKV